MQDAPELRVLTEPPRETRAPPSPRTLFHQASQHMADLHQQREQARKAYWSEAIAKSLR